jgi:hypothetical protein
MFSPPNEIKKSILNFQMGFSLTDVQGFFQFCVLVEDHFGFLPKAQTVVCCLYRWGCETLVNGFVDSTLAFQTFSCPHSHLVGVSIIYLSKNEIASAKKHMACPSLYSCSFSADKRTAFQA